MDESPNYFRKCLLRQGLLLAALIPLGLACYGTESIPIARPVKGRKELPPLAFRQYSVNLRDAPSTARLKAPFSFWNRSLKNIEITKLEPSCGCLAPQLLGNRKSYGPGGQGLFDVQVETARETPGPHAYSIRVHYTADGTPHEEVVYFRCDIPERIVTVTPPELYFYQLSGKPLSSELKIVDHRGKHLKVERATSHSPYLSLEVGASEEAGSQQTVTPIQITVAGDLPAGSQTSFITIDTDDADFPRIRVPVFLQGPSQSVRLTSGSMPALQNTEQSGSKNVAESSDAASLKASPETVRTP